MERILLFCRAGFETEAGRELTELAAEHGRYGYFQPEANAGQAMFVVADGGDARSLMQQVGMASLVFTRDWFEVIDDRALPASDRVGAVLEALREQPDRPPSARVEIRVPEDVERDLGAFSRKWASPLSRALRETGFLVDDESNRRRLEIFLPSFDRMILGISHADNRAVYLSGIPRLRLPASAPSRSALKLEEAWKVFIPQEQWLDYLGGGKKAVDLGAAPGGWTWQLVRQGMLVTAVDNGPLDEALMASGHVEHVRADGYLWRPQRAVDWMVCDIVDKPRRTTEMVVDWFGNRLCKFSVFNLKLPMKKRYDEWLVCRERLLGKLDATGVDVRLKARHLYHDREEITCFVERFS
ncbi:23S rRNA (cytidine(2498)-2'-O)-methyltransferase RlmM [Marinobacter halodurans]|uniref:Ribosomal RNA large subunit methyltransferase M n=1 Tax=Marinobacter halodurans TaxID=2528979 RepID=A0ABY1ZQC1_9GAMM|nr:23S rRNA (cytidine(2498)-2'-O)-methyltransferase RlmM [Marinobacter halodurans]TBW59153.1 23S rRNA (cytidine(2498)-2'-O)-methyltransferase RlmM [Marinobacter halodurans]